MKNKNQNQNNKKIKPVKRKFNNHLVRLICARHPTECQNFRDESFFVKNFRPQKVLLLEEIFFHFLLTKVSTQFST